MVVVSVGLRFSLVRVLIVVGWILMLMLRGCILLLFFSSVILLMLVWCRVRV